MLPVSRPLAALEIGAAKDELADVVEPGTPATLIAVVGWSGPTAQRTGLPASAAVPVKGVVLGGVGDTYLRVLPRPLPTH